MRAYELLSERVLDPLKEPVEQMRKILDKAVPEYEEEITFHGTKDDGSPFTLIEDNPDLLARILSKYSVGSLFRWKVVPEGGSPPVDWYVHSANVDVDGNMNFNLDPESMEGKWGPESFKEIIMKFVDHEAIHLSQRDRMGAEKYKSIPSGYTKGVRAAGDTDDFATIAKYYFRDPQEIMAHASDLANEIAKLKNPSEVIRNPEKYSNDLPTYDKHKKYGFGPEHKVIKKLLRYTADYLKKRGHKI